MNIRALSLLLLGGAVLATGTACNSGGDKADGEQNATGSAASPAAKAIAIDGSSTVFPITEAVAEEYQKSHRARVTVGVSGTGGGFKKFCKKELALTGASRPIKPSEVKLCADNGVEYIELPVAYDGLAVVVHKSNDWVDHLTTAELKVMWEPAAQKKITRWSQIREGWPDKPLRLFGPGVDSGTYDYFTKAIVGKEHASRGDFTSSEDDNVLVHGVSGDTSALAFFRFAYYAANTSKLKLVPIDDGNEENGKGAIAPSPETVSDNTYQPLARPIFIYLSKAEAKRPEVQKFVDFYLEQASKLAAEVGYISLPKEGYALAKKRFEARKTGSMFEGKGATVGVSIQDLLRTR